MQRKLERIRMVIMDVDGVLTDGRIVYDDAGTEYKLFNAHDGYGIERGLRLGLRFALVSGRRSNATRVRARELGIADVHQGVADKLRAIRSIKSKHKLSDGEICYVGDDVPDLPVMAAVGFGAAPCDALPEVRAKADYVTRTASGRGAVREVIDLILRARMLVE